MMIWTSKRRRAVVPRAAVASRLGWIGLIGGLLAGASPANADIITHLPTSEKVVALTFDACENKTPASFDKKITDFLLAHKIPATLFITGRFARHNKDVLVHLANQDFIEIENHSLNHDNHMDRLPDDALRAEVTENDTLLAGITGRHTRYFRFPAGNAGERALRDVEDLGYKVVHWSFESGDPVKDLTPEALSRWVLAKARPGSIMIFHINGRGWSTGEALPGIVETLRQRGYRFVRLDQILP